MIRLTPELEARLTRLAARQGRDPNELVQEPLTCYLEEETSFLEAVEKGVAAAERGSALLITVKFPPRVPSPTCANEWAEVVPARYGQFFPPARLPLRIEVGQIS